MSLETKETLFRQLPTALCDCVLDNVWFEDWIALRLLRRGAGDAVAAAWARKTTLRLLHKEWVWLSPEAALPGKRESGAAAFWALAERCEYLHTIDVGIADSSSPLRGADRECFYKLVGRHAPRLRTLRLYCEPPPTLGAADVLAGCISLEALSLRPGLSETFQRDLCEKLAATCPALRELELSRPRMGDPATIALLDGLADAGVWLERFKLDLCYDTRLLAALVRHPLRVLELTVGFTLFRDVDAEAARAVHDALRALLIALQPSLRELTLAVSAYSAPMSTKAREVLAAPLPLWPTVERLTIRGAYTPPFFMAWGADGSGNRSAALQILYVRGAVSHWNWSILLDAAVNLRELYVDCNLTQAFEVATLPISSTIAGVKRGNLWPALRRLECEWQHTAAFDSVLAVCPHLESLTLSSFGAAMQPPSSSRFRDSALSSPPLPAAAVSRREHKALLQLELGIVDSGEVPSCTYVLPSLCRLHLSLGTSTGAWPKLLVYLVAAAPTLKCLDITRDGWFATQSETRDLPESLPLLTHLSLEGCSANLPDTHTLLRRVPALKHLDVRSTFVPLLERLSVLGDCGAPGGIFSQLDCLSGKFIHGREAAALRKSFVRTAPGLRHSRPFANS